jgi:uncharacterized protein (DUF4415 family)
MTAEKIIWAITTTDGRTLIALPDGIYREVQGETDWAALDAMSEAEIEQRASENMAELAIDPDWMDHATVIAPHAKKRITVRLDHDILDWPKTQGRGYQTRINAILRAYVETQKGRR